MCNAGLQRPLDEVIIEVAPDRASGVPDFKGFPYNTNSFGGHQAGSPQNFLRLHFLDFQMILVGSQMTFEMEKAGAVCRDNWGLEFLDWQSCREESRCSHRAPVVPIDWQLEETWSKCSASWGRSTQPITRLRIVTNEANSNHSDNPFFPQMSCVGQKWHCTGWWLVQNMGWMGVGLVGSPPSLALSIIVSETNPPSSSLTVSSKNVHLDYRWR